MDMPPEHPTGTLPSRQDMRTPTVPTAIEIIAHRWRQPWVGRCARGSERLSFAFEPAAERGWGLIHIKSDVEGAASGDALEALLNKALERKP